MSCSRTKFISKFETLTREIKADIRKQNDLHVNNLVGDVKANPRDFSGKRYPRYSPLEKQHAFRKWYSCETEFITVIDDWAKIIDIQVQVDTFILDFEKAFDPPPPLMNFSKANCLAMESELKQ